MTGQRIVDNCFRAAVEVRGALRILRGALFAAEDWRSVRGNLAERLQAEVARVCCGPVLHIAAYAAEADPSAPAVPEGWLRPLDDFFATLEARIGDETISDGALLDGLELVAGLVPELLDEMDVDGLAELMAAGMRAAVLGAAGEAVTTKYAEGTKGELAGFAAEAPGVEYGPLPEAVAKMAGKTPVAARLTSAQWANMETALRERAQFSAKVESVRFLGTVQEKLHKRLALERETLANGKQAFVDRDSFIRDMRKVAEEEGIQTTDAAGKGTVRDIRSVKRLGLIWDQQTQSAAEHARWKMGQDADVLDEFPGWRFVRVIPVAQPRDWHAQFEGAVRLKTDLDFWTRINQDFGVPWGPWGWNCGHDVEEVDRTECEQLGLVKPGEKLQPADEDFNRRLQASVEGWRPDQISTLRQVFGDQAEIDEASGTVRWKG